MPRGDRTGPNRTGPMTGRRAGYCAGSSVPGYMKAFTGFGRGCGFGRGLDQSFNYGAGYGRAWSVGYGPAPLTPITPKAEKEFLSKQTELLESELQAIRKRLEEIQNIDE